MADESTESTPKKWWPRFFAKFGETGIVSIAAKAAGVDRSLVYRYARECPEFAARWQEAERQAIGTLEDMATQRALKTSDTLLIFLLKTRAREKYGDVVRNEHTGNRTITHREADEEAILAAADEIKCNRERLPDIEVVPDGIHDLYLPGIPAGDAP